MHRGNVTKRMAIETAKALTNCCLLWQILDHSVVRHRCEVLLWNYAMLWRIVKWRCWGGEAVDTGTPAVACQWIICLRSTPTLTHKYKRTYYLPNILVKTTLTHRRTFYFNLLHIDVFSFRSVFILTSVQALLQWKPQTFSEGTQNYVAGERNTLQVTFSVWRWPSMFLEYLV